MKSFLLVLCLWLIAATALGQHPSYIDADEVILSRSSLSLGFAPQLSWYSNSSALGSISLSAGLQYTYYFSPTWQIEIPVSYSQQRGQDVLVRCFSQPCTGLDVEQTAYIKLAILPRYRIAGSQSGQLLVKGGPFVGRLVYPRSPVAKYATLTAGMSGGLMFMYQVLPQMDMSLGLQADVSLTDMENPNAMGTDGQPFYPTDKPKAIASNLGLAIALNWYFRKNK